MDKPHLVWYMRGIILLLHSSKIALMTHDFLIADV